MLKSILARFQPNYTHFFHATAYPDQWKRQESKPHQNSEFVIYLDRLTPMNRALLVLFSFVIGLPFFLCSEEAQASQPGVVKVSRVTVYSQPNRKSEPLVQLKKGQKIKVVSRRRSWFRVRLSIKGGFEFSGWIPVRAVAFKKRPSRRRVQPRKPYVPPTRMRKPSRSPSRATTVTRRGERTWIEGRLTTALTAGYSIYSYTLNTGGAAPEQIFIYNLAGPSVGVDLDYWFWEGFGDVIQTGVDIGYRRTFLQFDTSLADTTATVFQGQTSKSSLDDLVFLIKGEYKMAPHRFSSSFGLNLGFSYFKFNADDAVDLSGQGIGLFVAQKTSSLLGGVYAHIPFYFERELAIDLAVNTLFLNWVSESPADTTGTNPKASLGIHVPAGLTYVPWDGHKLGLTYELRWQKYNFTGTASRINVNNVTDGSIVTMVHNLGMVYRYMF